MKNKGLKIIVGDSDFTGEQIIEKHIIPRLEEIKEASAFSIEEWEEPEDSENLQTVIDYMVENKEYFDNIESFTTGDMVYEVCMLSEIEQGDYTKFLKTFKNLKSIYFVGGYVGLAEDHLYHENLEEIKIETTSLYSGLLRLMSSAKLPSLRSLTLYFGSEESGCDCEIDGIRSLLENESVRQVESLGLVNSELEDAIVEILFKDGYIDKFENLKKLDLSYGLLTGKSAKILLENSERVNKLEKVVIEKHGIIDEDLINDLRDEYDHLEITDECHEYEEDDEGNVDYYDLPIFTE